MNKLSRWNLTGIFVLTVLGFLLHFLFQWTGNSKIIGLIAPVNESVWEHLKLGYWAVMLFSIVEYPQINQSVHNYFFAKTVGVLALEFTIVIIFYGYTFFSARAILLIDILSYVIGVILCQYVSYKVLSLQTFPWRIQSLSLAIFIGIAVLFAVTTYYPPHYRIFLDTNNNTYGINKEF